MEDVNGFTHCIKCQNSVFSIYLIFFVSVPTDLFWTRHTYYLLTSDWFINNEIRWDVHVHVYVYVAWT